MLMHRTRTAIVTGAGRNIGSAIAHLLAEGGYAIAVLDIDAESAAATAAAVGSRAGVPTLAVIADVRSVPAVAAAVDEVIAWSGRIDVLVNSAGIPRGQPLASLDEASWDRTIDTNLKGTFLCIKAVAPHMIAAGRGAIVNLSSTASLGYARQLDYSASKGGVDALTVTSALELAPSGIRVNCVAPGPVVPEGKDPRDRHSPKLKPFIDETPLGRLATPRDIANVVAFLCSDEAACVVGQRIQVSGGRNTGYWGGFGRET